MPLLVVFVVAIFDFTGAYTLKQKLANAAREGARAAAAAPAGDVGNTTAPAPASVYDAYDVVVNYLDNSKVNDCGLRTVVPTSSGLTWTYASAGNAGNGCPLGGVTLIINRGCVSTTATGLNLAATCVQLRYAYKWQFNRVITLLVPTANYGPTSTISSIAVAMNEN